MSINVSVDDKKGERVGFNKDIVFGGVIIVLVALLTLSVMTKGFGLFNEKNDTNPVVPVVNNTGSNTGSGEKPLVQLFTMSYCPYGNIAEEGIQPAVELLGDKIEFEPRYVIYANYGGEGYCIGNGAYCSLHGVQELNQDIREQCVWENDNGKYWNFVFAMNDKCNYKNADTCWESVAQSLGIDTSMVKQCEKNNALTFADDSYVLNQKYGVRGSPTLVIDGKEVAPTSRTPEAYKQVICDAFDSKPAECSTVLSSASGGAVTGGCG